jgi:hypothetical protein
MKDSTWLAIILGIVLALVVGVAIGYAVAVEEVHKEAVANGTGRWVPASSQGVVFAWGAP